MDLFGDASTLFGGDEVTPNMSPCIEALVAIELTAVQLKFKKYGSKNNKKSASSASS